MSSLLRDLRSLGRTATPPAILPAVLDRLGLAEAGRVRMAPGDVAATDRYTTLESPIGRVFVAFNDRGATAVMRAPSARAFERAYIRTTGRAATKSASRPGWLTRRPLRADLSALTPFEQAVLHKAAEIPPGEVRTYSWVAREIRRPAAVRAVGSALGRNPIPLLIPCHRVVRTDGRIGDFIYGTPAKRALLRSEGVDPEQLEGFLGSDTTKIFCFPTCRAARRITERHRVLFRSHRDAKSAGYRPCKLCRPAA